MTKVFLDTGAIVALSDKHDQYHRQAVEAYGDLKKDSVFVITNYTFAETVTLVRRRVGLEQTLLLGERLMRSKRVVFHRVKEVEEREAWALLRKYGDKDLSFVDCTSFAIMRKNGIDAAFTFNDHFRQLGFHVIP